MKQDLQIILKQIGIDAEGPPFGNGHINEPYILEGTPRKILQRINPSVFKDPDAVMENVCAVMAYLSDMIKREGGDPLRETCPLLTEEPII